MPVSRMINRLSISGGTDYPIRSIVPPAGSNPTQILYLKVIYQIDDDHLSPTYSYDDNSGTYATSNITTFLNCVRDNDFSSLTRIRPVPANPPIPVVEYASYIVMAIDPNGPAEFSTVDRIKTDDTYQHDYFNLILAPDDPADPSAPYHIAYFRCKSPSDRWTNTNPHQSDGFNLYLDFMTSNGSGSGALDPDIKNTGHGFLPPPTPESK